MCPQSVVDLIAALVDGCSSIKCTFRVLSKWDQSVSDPQICALLWPLWQKLLQNFQPNRKKYKLNVNVNVKCRFKNFKEYQRYLNNKNRIELLKQKKKQNKNNYYKNSKKRKQRNK